MDPDPGGSKTCGSGGFGSGLGSATLVFGIPIRIQKLKCIRIRIRNPANKQCFVSALVSMWCKYRRNALEKLGIRNRIKKCSKILWRPDPDPGEANPCGSMRIRKTEKTMHLFRTYAELAKKRLLLPLLMNLVSK
jgi:hypothetical protein